MGSVLRNVARDFQNVTHGSQLVGGLASVPRPWARLNRMYFDSSKNGVQTSMVGIERRVLCASTISTPNQREGHPGILGAGKQNAGEAGYISMAT